MTDVRADRSGEQPWRRLSTDSASIRAGSYIWQPWFAQVNGGLGLVLSKEHVSGEGAPNPNQARDSQSTNVFGNGNLALFPVSRFPFNAYFDVSDSRASGNPTASDTRNTRVGLRQSYRPPEGDASYVASFDRSTLESRAFGQDTVDALAVGFNRVIGPQTFDLRGSHTRNMRGNTGESTALSQLNAMHGYRSGPEFTVNSLASASSSDFRLLSRGAFADNRSDFLQANTFVTWRPEEDSPLLVTGGGRMYRALINNNTVSTEMLTLSGNVAATYMLSRQTTISGGATLTQVASDESSTLVTTQTATVNHVGDPLGLQGFSYRWNAAANLGNQSGAGTRQNLGGQIGHNANREFALGAGSHVSVNLGQTLSATYDTATASSQVLGHSGSVSWRLAHGPSTSAYASLLGADSRTTGHNANQFQLINFQASGQLQFSRNASAAANLTMQGTRQKHGAAPDAGMVLNTSGSLSYFNNRIFDVPRLRYSALYSINESQFNTRLQGDVNAPRERVSQSLEQRFDYSLGRVAMRLSMRVADIEGRREALVFFRLERTFGAF